MPRASTARAAARARASISEELAADIAASAPKPTRCTGHTKTGTRCTRKALPGAIRCKQHIRAPGRPTKLDEDTTEKIVEILRQGGYVETAAAVAGLSKQTFYNWFNRGDPDGTKKADAPYRQFRECIDQALAEGEANNVAIVQKAASEGDWKAAAWLLERRHPDKFAGPRGRRLDSIHPDDFAAGEKSAPGQGILDDQVGPDGRPL